MATRRRVSRAWNKAYRALTDRAAEKFETHAYSLPLPSQLFHFTDCDGLVGILKTKKLWASLVTSLNDRSEMEYGRVLAKDCIQNGDFAVRSLNLARLDQALERQSWRVYVVSFCANSDTALHWLHYGRSGSGVAMAFNPLAIQKAPFELWPVLYERGRQIEWIRAIVESIDEALTSALDLTATDTDRELLKDLALDLLATQLWMVTPRMKSAAFSAEGEWRLLTYVPRGEGVPTRDDSKAIEFRTIGGRIVPYKEVFFDILPISEIVLGSSSPIQQDVEALAVLIEKELGDADQPMVSPSKVLVRL